MWQCHGEGGGGGKYCGRLDGSPGNTICKLVIKERPNTLYSLPSNEITVSHQEESGNKTHFAIGILLKLLTHRFLCDSKVSDKRSILIIIDDIIHFYVTWGRL